MIECWPEASPSGGWRDVCALMHVDPEVNNG